MKFVSIIILMFIYTFSFSQEDTLDLLALNILAPYNYTIDSSWIENHNAIVDRKELEFIHSLDSALIVSTNHKFIHAIIHSLLAMRHDSGYQVIIKHFASKGYCRPSSPFAGIKYPVKEAILSADKSHWPFFREFLLQSNYFEKEINDDDIGLYRILLLSGKATECDIWKVPFKPSAIFRSNLQAILGDHIIFNY
ncbi:MAG: hypothetical protein IPP25_16325 [Saprospiraceae bacterium]|nr:hypothetical protein [Candidatus Opimibacter skivensis]